MGQRRNSLRRFVSLAVALLALHLSAHSQSSKDVGTYKVTDPVTCVVVKNDGGPVVQNNCDFSVYVAYCIDAGIGATDDAKKVRCSAGAKPMVWVFAGKTATLRGESMALGPKDSTVQYIAACENPNKSGFGGGVFRETVVFYKLVYSGTGVTASCLTPVAAAKGGRLEKYTNLMFMTEDIRVVGDR